MKRTLEAPVGTSPGAALLLERHGTDAADRRRWSSRAALLVPLAAVGMVVASVVIVVLAQGRGRPDEVAAGVVLAFFAVAFLLWGVSRREPALATLASLGVLVQVAATFYYYYSELARDASAYHTAALTVLDPSAELSGQFGLERSEWANWVMAQFVASIYRITGPSQLAAFFVFAAVGLSAKIVFAHTVLRLRPLLGQWAVPAAAAAMLMPSLAIWLAAISKEALAVLGVSLTLAGIARPVGRNPSATLILMGIGIAATTRPQISLLLAGSVAAYAARLASSGIHSAARRFAFLTVSLVFVIGSATVAATFLGTDLSLEGFASARDDTASVGPRGGSGIEPRPIRGPGDVLAAANNVLLRPHLGEASTATMLAQAAENTAVALAFAIILLRVNGRRKHLVYGAEARVVRALRFYCLVYTMGFVYMLSGAYNLGLLNRQRSQLSLILILLVVLGLVRARSSREDAAGGTSLATAKDENIGHGPSTPQRPQGVNHHRP